MIDSKNSSATPTPMWHAVIDPVPVPDTSMLPPGDAPALVGDEMMNRAVKGAHATIDRIADGVAPTVRELGERVTSVEDALQAKTDQILETRDQWSASVRAAVRKRPLASVAGALAVGALIARIAR